MRIKGWSVSSLDLVAVVTSVAGGVLLLMGRTVGTWVFDETGSLVLGSSAWIGTYALSALGILAGIAYLLSASRTYRYPGDTSELERVR